MYALVFIFVCYSLVSQIWCFTIPPLPPLLVSGHLKNDACCFYLPFSEFLFSWFRYFLNCDPFMCCYLVVWHVQGAGIAILPHLSDLVCCMLESLSSLEDQGLNYVEVRMILYATLA